MGKSSSPTLLMSVGYYTDQSYGYHLDSISYHELSATIRTDYPLEGPVDSTVGHYK